MFLSLKRKYLIGTGVLFDTGVFSCTTQIKDLMDVPFYLAIPDDVTALQDCK